MVLMRDDSEVQKNSGSVTTLHVVQPLTIIIGVFVCQLHNPIKVSYCLFLKLKLQQKNVRLAEIKTQLNYSVVCLVC